MMRRSDRILAVWRRAVAREADWAEASRLRRRLYRALLLEYGAQTHRNVAPRPVAERGAY
jgi:hypothetical protein